MLISGADREERLRLRADREERLRRQTETDLGDEASVRQRVEVGKYVCVVSVDLLHQAQRVVYLQGKQCVCVLELRANREREASRDREEAL